MNLAEKIRELYAKTRAHQNDADRMVRSLRELVKFEAKHNKLALDNLDPEAMTMIKATMAQYPLIWLEK